MRQRSVPFNARQSGISRETTLKLITYRRRFCVHRFGRRSKRISRLTALLLSSVMAHTWPGTAGAQKVVSAGQTAMGAGVPTGPGQAQWVMSVGTAISAVVNGAAKQQGASSTAIGTTQTVVDGRTAAGTTLSNGVQYIASGGSATDTVISGLGAAPAIAQPGAITLTAVDPGALRISAIPSAPNGVTILVSSGGSVRSATLDAALQFVDSGGTATRNTIIGGVQLVNGGGTTFDNDVAGGVQIVNGSGSSATRNSLIGSVQVIDNGGAASHVAILGGVQCLDAGATATSNALTASYQFIGYASTATSNTLHFSAQDIGYRGTAKETTLDHSVQRVMSGGTAIGTSVNSASKQQVLGGSAVSTVINSGGTQTVASGGIATRNSVNDGGVQYVTSGGGVVDTVVSSGGEQYVAGGAATINVVDGGTQTITSGGLATSNTVLAQGAQYVAASGTATQTWVGGGGHQYVVGGAANGNTIDRGGAQIVASGGIATSNSINNGGVQYVASAGTAVSTTVNSGMQTVGAGGTVIGTTVNPGGAQYLTNGSLAANTTLNGGVQSVNAGGLANVTMVNAAGFQAVNDGALTNATVINNGGLQVVMAGGVTSGSVVNSGGKQNVLGTVVSATVDSGGTLMVGQGGTSGKLAGNTHNDGTIVFNLAGTYTYSGAFTGSGTLVDAHTGTLILNGASNAYSGATQVVAGTLEVGDSAHTSATLGGDVVVSQAGTLRGHGTIGGSVINAGIVSPGGSIGTTTIAGDYQQAANATLQVEISPTSASQLDVMGNATLAGTLAVVYDAGSNGASSVYGPGSVKLLKASSIDGRFSGAPLAIVQSGANLSYVTPSVTYKANEVDLLLTPNDTSIFTAMGSAVSQVAQATNAAILDRLSHLCRTHKGRNCIAGTDNVWIKATGDYSRTDNKGGVSGYSAHQYGFIAGYDHRIGRYDVGGTLAYSHVDVSEAHTPDTGTADSLRWAAYGAMWTGPVNLAATIGLGYDFIDQKRPFGTATGTASGSHNGLEVTAAAQASMPLPSLGGFVLIPRAGLRFAYFHGDAFSESGAGAQNLSVGTDNIQSVQPYAQLALRYAFGSASTPSNMEAYVGYAYEAGTTNRAVSVSAQDGTLFTANGVPLPRNLVTAGISLNMRVTRSLWVSAAFDTLLHTANASIKAGSIKVDYRF